MDAVMVEAFECPQCGYQSKEKNSFIELRDAFIMKPSMTAQKFFFKIEEFCELKTVAVCQRCAYIGTMDKFRVKVFECGMCMNIFDDILDAENCCIAEIIDEEDAMDEGAVPKASGDIVHGAAEAIDKGCKGCSFDIDGAISKYGDK